MPALNGRSEAGEKEQKVPCTTAVVLQSIEPLASSEHCLFPSWRTLLWGGHLLRRRPRRSQSARYSLNCCWSTGPLFTTVSLLQASYLDRRTHPSPLHSCHKRTYCPLNALFAKLAHTYSLNVKRQSVYGVLYKESPYHHQCLFSGPKHRTIVRRRYTSVCAECAVAL